MLVRVSEVSDMLAEKYSIGDYNEDDAMTYTDWQAEIRGVSITVDINREIYDYRWDSDVETW